MLRAAVRWDWQGARADLERALRLNPGDGHVHLLYATQVLWPVGRLPEAIAEVRLATELDPLDDLAWSFYGSALAADAQLERALEALDRSFEIWPQAGAPYRRAIVLLLLGRYDEALAWAGRCALAADRLWATALATHSLGRAEESRRALDALVAAYSETAAYQIATVFAWRGERAQAFAWLERAYRQHDAGLALVKRDPLFRELRGDPRFAALVRKVGLPLP